MPDLADFYYQSGLDLRSGIIPYSKTTDPVAFPPAALFVFYLLSFLPLLPLQVFWTLLSFSSLLVSIGLLAKNKKELFVFTSLAFLSFPVKFTFGMGQINHFILLFVTLNLIFFLKNKDFLSGLFLALSLLLKMTPVLLLPFFLLRKKFRLIFWCFFCLLLVFIFPYFFFGKTVYQDYFFTALPRLFNSFGNSFYYNQSLLAMITRLLGKVPVTMAVYIMSVVLILVSTFIRVVAPRRAPAKDYLLILTANLLLNGICWQHHLVFLLPAMVILYQQLVKNSRKRLWLVFLGVAFLLVSVNIKNPHNLMGSLWGNFFLSHGTWGIAFLWLLLFLT